MAESGTQVCPVCGVKILKVIGGDRVLFSVGAPGSREDLWKRVCQYAQKPGCINKEGGSSKSSFPTGSL
jgi:hypothetical protein